MRIPRLAILLFASFLGACSSIVSTPLVNETQSATGVPYMLPQAVLPVILREQDGRFDLEILAPKYFGDPSQAYIAHYSPSIFSDDTVDIKVGQNGLLTSVNVTMADRLDDVIVNLAKSIVAVKTGFVGTKETDIREGGITLANLEIDPSSETNVSSARSRLQAAATAHIKRQKKTFCGDETEDEAGDEAGDEAEEEAEDEAEKEAEVEAAKKKCTTYTDLEKEGFCIALSAKPHIAVAASTAKCSSGICVRLPIPYEISTGFGQTGCDAPANNNANSGSVVVPLPNGSPPVAINFDRALFVTKVNNITFTNGMATILHVKKPSEAVDLAILPARIVQAVFSQITETFKSKSAAINEQLAFLKKKAELEKVLDKKITKESFVDPTKAILSVNNGVPVSSSAADIFREANTGPIKEVKSGELNIEVEGGELDIEESPAE